MAVSVKVPPAAPLPAQGITLGIDWISAVSADVGAYHALRGYLIDTLGLPESTGAVAKWYASSERWSVGVTLSAGGPESGAYRVELSGSYLSTLQLDARVDLLRRLTSTGWRCTRLDLCADVVGYKRSLFDSMLASCRDGDLVHARRYSPYEELSSGMPVGRTLYIGRRGNLGSGRFVRCYDKGLEQRAAPVGAWERFELETSGRLAHTYAVAVATARNVLSAIKGHLLGCIDFRRRSTVRRHLESRPRVDWWAEFVACVDTTIHRAVPRTSDVHALARWLTRAVAPVLSTIAGASGRSPSAVLSDLVAEWIPSRSDRSKRSASQYCHLLAT